MNSCRKVTFPAPFLNFHASIGSQTHYLEVTMFKTVPVFEKRSCYVVQGNLEFKIFSSMPLECCN